MATTIWDLLLRLKELQNTFQLLPTLGLPIGLRGDDLVALPDAADELFELLGDTIKPDMGLAENELTKALTFDDKSERFRAFQTALFLGVSEVKPAATGSEGRTEPVKVLGLGLRRSTKVWPRGAASDDALRADLELYIPCYATQNGERFEHLDALPASKRLIQIGLALTRDGNALTEEVPLSGLRFVGGAPLTGRLPDPFDERAGAMDLGTPMVLSKRRKVGAAQWQDVKAEYGDNEKKGESGWHKCLSALLGSEDGKALINAPIAPVTATNLNTSFLLELVRTAADSERQKTKDITKELKRLREQIEQTWQVELEEEKGEHDKGLSRSLGDFLVSLGFLYEDNGKRKLLKLKAFANISYFQVLQSAFRSIDGMPLLATGLNTQKAWQGALQIASSPDFNNPARSAFGFRALAQDFYLRRAAKPLEDKKAEKKRQKKPDVEVLLQFGKWLSGETLDDNWVRRLLPKEQTDPLLPGVAVYPLSLAISAQDSGAKADVSSTLRSEMVSMGVDILGATKAGLGGKGPFRLGGIEARMLLMHQPAGPVRFGLGVKLSGIQIDLSSKPPKIPFASDLLGILSGLLYPDDDQEEDEEVDNEELSHGTRLEDENYFKNKFAFSLGYLTPDVIDAQLYDAKGRRGKLVWINVHRGFSLPLTQAETFGGERNHGLQFFIENIGLELEGWERTSLTELVSPLAEDATDLGPKFGVRVSVALTLGPLRLAFIGAGITAPVRRLSAPKFKMEGLDLSLLAPPTRIFGTFVLETTESEPGGNKAQGFELVGAVCIEVPAFSIMAVGAFSTLTTHDKNDDGDEISSTLHTGFFFGALSAARGGGVQVGPIRFTGIALGFGINRSLAVPEVDGIAKFSLVELVMGEGGLQKPEKGKPPFKDPREAMGKPPPAPYKILESMQKEIKAEKGSYFGCAGVRFMIAESVDCFALAVVTASDNNLAFSLLGLARLRLPRPVAGAALPDPICYVELQLLAALKPNAGIFQFEGALTNKSWIISPDCKLSGGFALRVWFSGEHNGDMVFSIGGYHPAFKRPAHYPVVPRLALHWKLTEHFIVEGALYLAFTPSCLMFGGRLGAVFRDERLYVAFSVSLDVLLEWDPLHYEVLAKLMMEVEIDLALSTVSVAISALFEIWGPPVGGRVDLEVVGFKVSIPFGETRQPPELIPDWDSFEARFLDTAVTQLNLTSGRQQREREDQWSAHVDQVGFAVSSLLPITRLEVGTVHTNSPPEGVMPVKEAGVPRTTSKPVKIANAKSSTGPEIGARPMGQALESVARITVVRDTARGAEAVDLSGWTFDERRTAMPAGLWCPDKPDPAGPREPSAELIRDCITGINALRPPVGQVLGESRASFAVDALAPKPLPSRAVPPVPAAIPEPIAGTTALDLTRELEQTLQARKEIGSALAGFGFALPAATANFRRLRGQASLGRVARRAK